MQQLFFTIVTVTQSKMVTFKSYSISRKFTFNFIEILFLMLLSGNLQRGVPFHQGVVGWCDGAG